MVLLHFCDTCVTLLFSVASESALEILTDILDDFNTKFCHLLRMAVDNEALNGRTGFSVSDMCVVTCFGVIHVLYFLVQMVKLKNTAIIAFAASCRM